MAATHPRFLTNADTLREFASFISGKELLSTVIELLVRTLAFVRVEGTDSSTAAAAAAVVEQVCAHTGPFLTVFIEDVLVCLE